MRGKWRLVNRNELYDIDADPLQQESIAEQHPRLAEELRAGYEVWWEVCSEQMDDDIPTSLGAEAQEMAVLRSHDLRNEQDHSVVWNQSQVRKGTGCLGYWEVFVERAGGYEFELRRWPQEAGHKIAGGIEGEDVEFFREGIAPGAEDLYSGGTALNFDTASLSISSLPQQCVEVGPGDAGATFRVTLEPGPRHVRAVFSNCSGRYCSAYYVYVRRLE